MKNIPAFPSKQKALMIKSEHIDIASEYEIEHNGMTLRDYFAASFVSSGHVFKCISEGDKPSLVAEQAYAMADEMMRAREFEEGWYDYEGC